MPIYLQIDGIEGDATQEQHRRWTDIEALHWHVERNMNTTAGSAANREASEPTVSEITLTKVSDSSTPKLFREGTSGSTGKAVKIHFVTTGNPGNTYLEYTLTNTLVAHYSVNSSGDRPIETVKLNFTKVEMKYTPYDEDQSAKSPIIASYDLATTKAS